MVGFCLGGRLVASDDDEGWTREFRIGAVTCLNLTAKFSTHGTFGVANTSQGPVGVSGANHIYDDGYVKVDSTGNAHGVTSDWGYVNSSQYNVARQTLTYHATTSYTVQDQTQLDGELAAGFEMAYGGKIYQWRNTRVGWEFGFEWLPISMKDDRPLSATFDREVHQFSTGGISLPQAPYNGTAYGLGPVIQDVATALPDQMGSSGVVTGTRKLECALYGIHLGPTFNWSLLPRIGLGVSAGGAMGLLDGRFSYDETLVFENGGKASGTGSKGQMNFVYGGYVSAIFHFFIQPDADIYAGAEFLSLGHQHYDLGGREANLDLSKGIQFVAGIHWPF